MSAVQRSRAPSTTFCATARCKMGLQHIYTCDYCAKVYTSDSAPSEHNPFPPGWVLIRVHDGTGSYAAYACSKTCARLMLDEFGT